MTLKFGDNSIAIYSLKWSVTPTFLSRNIFYLQLSPYCPKMKKKSMWEDLKISSFLSTRHRILPSCSCKVRDTMVAKCELVLQGTSAVDQIHLIGPLKQYLAEKISLQRSICNIFGLTDTVAYSLTKPDFFRFRVFFRACSLQNEVGDPPFFYISNKSNSSSYSGKNFRKKSMLENFRANVLKENPVNSDYTNTRHSM